MKLCSKDCSAVCDFCDNYSFNPGSEGEYVNKGFCNLLGVKKDPDGSCDDFCCFRNQQK